MRIKTLFKVALDTISQYENVPYFNNKTLGTRGALKAEVGKGSPEDIREEVKNIAIREKINIDNLDKDNLKRFLVDHNKDKGKNDAREKCGCENIGSQQPAQSPPRCGTGRSHNYARRKRSCAHSL